MAPKFLRLLGTFLISLVTYSQNPIDSIVVKRSTKVLALGFIHEIGFIQKAGSTQKYVKFDGEEIATVEFVADGNCEVYTESNDYFLAPETYNIGISLIKDKSNQYIGMTKRYANVHLIGIENRVFKLEQVKSSAFQYKLSELQDEKTNQGSFSKKIFMKDQNGKMEIFHNLSDIPVAVFPIMLNTKKINKKINGKVAGSLLLSAVLIALRILISTNL